MKLNMTLVIAGTLILCTGLYRAYPPKLGKLLFFLVPISLMFLAEVAVLWQSQRFDIISGTIDKMLTTTGQYLPMLVILFASMALGGQLVDKVYGAEVERFLLNHGSLGALGAALFTASSSVASNVVDLLWKKRELQNQLMLFMMASPLLSLSIFMFRLVGIQTKEVIMRTYVISVVASIVMIPIVKLEGLIYGKIHG